MTHLVSFLPASPSSTINLISVPLVSFFPECHISRFIKYVAFCICLFSFGTMCLLFIHLVACIDCPSLFNAEKNCVVQMHFAITFVSLLFLSSKLVCVTVRRHCIYITVVFFFVLYFLSDIMGENHLRMQFQGVKCQY